MNTEEQRKHYTFQFIGPLDKVMALFNKTFPVSKDDRTFAYTSMDDEVEEDGRHKEHGSINFYYAGSEQDVKNLMLLHIDSAIEWTVREEGCTFDYRNMDKASLGACLNIVA